ncbi:excalibur calcium-binding domain-containing protein [Mycobacterium decipiens]
MSSSGSCVYRNCTDAKAHGRCNIPTDDPAYCPKQDRDNDGLACEC